MVLKFLNHDFGYIPTLRDLLFVLVGDNNEPSLQSALLHRSS